MTRIPKEQVFFFASFALCGFLAWSLWSSPYKPRPPEKGTTIDAVEPIQVSTSPDGATPADWLKTDRSVFQEPRDWFPLPPVALKRPPLHEPAMVAPFPDPCVALAHLKGAYRVVFLSVDHSFAGEAAPEAPAEAARAADEAGPAKKPEASVLQSADEEYRKRYDWLELQNSRQPWYGIIKNREKYTLNQRKDEPVEFQRVDPATGRLQGKSPIERSQLKDNGIHLADNVVNQVELILLEVPAANLGAASTGSLVRIAERAMDLGAQDSYAYQRTLEALKKYDEQKPDEPRLYELLADCHRRLFDFENEVRVLQTGEDRGLKSSGLVERKARWLWDRGARQIALALLEKAVKADLNDRGLRLLYGDLLVQAARGDDAVQVLKESEELSEDREQRRAAHIEIGESMLSLGRVADAVEQAEKKILAISADDLSGLRLLAAARYAENKLDAAQAAFRKIIDNASSAVVEGEARLGVALVLAHAGDLDESLRQVDLAVALDPLLGGRGLLAKSFAYGRGGAQEVALQSAAQAVERAPRDPYARYYHGRFRRLNGDLETAGSELRLALTLGATFSELFNELGYLALLASDAKSAVRYFEESLAREDRPETQILHAHALVDADRLLEAQRSFATLHQRKPSPDTQLGLSYCAYKSGDSAGAQKQMLELTDLFATAGTDYVEYAKTSLAEIIDRESKSQWEDFILWRQVGNGWSLNERYGISPRISTGSFRLAGTQRPGTGEENWTWLERSIGLHTFHEFAVDLTINAGNQGRVGVAIVNFVQGGPQGSEPVKRAALIAAIDASGTVAVRKGKNLEELSEPWKAVGKTATDAPIELGLRRMEKGASKFQVLLDGAPIGEPIEIESWRSSKQQVAALFFVCADGGRSVDATMTRARLVRYQE